MPKSKHKLETFYLVCAACLVLIVLGCVLYAQRDLALVHLHVRQIASSEGANEASQRWLAERPILALDALLGALHYADEARAPRIGRMIAAILDAHSDVTEPSSTHLGLSVAARMDSIYGELPAAGRLQVAEIAFSLAQLHLAQWSPNVPTALESAGRVVGRALDDPDPEIALRILRELRPVWGWNANDGAARSLVEEWKHALYTRAVRLAEHPLEEVRMAAVASLRGAPYHEGDGVLIGRAQDTSPSVRVAALECLTELPENTLTQAQRVGLFTFLVSEDVEVRRLAEAALLRSGLRADQIELARLLKCPEDSGKLELLHRLRSTTDINPLPVFLELMSDPSPTIRLAATRAAGSAAWDTKIAEKLRSLAANDPDMQVRDLARSLLPQVEEQASQPFPPIPR